MSFRPAPACLFLAAGTLAAMSDPVAAFNQGLSLNASDATRLEGVLASNPEDMEARAQLIGYYAAAPAHDVDWSNRMRLLSWMVEQHPEAALVGLPQLWPGMPDAMFQQIKPSWVAQVHQHPDDYQVLRNAASFFVSKNAPAATPGIRVGPNIAAANLVSSEAPIYPPLARQARVQGTVRFTVTIGKDGHIVNIQLVSGHPLLVKAAQEALQQYVYKPTLLNGKPVQVFTTVDINFNLDSAAIQPPLLQNRGTGFAEFHGDLLRVAAAPDR